MLLLGLLRCTRLYLLMPKQDRKEKEPREATKEKVSVYFACPSGLIKEVETIARLAGFMSKEEAIRQALREFVQNYAPEYYRASQATEAQVSTMALMWEKYPNLPAIQAALKARSAGLPP